MTSKLKRLLPGAVWITGLSASGKSTLSEGLYNRLKQDGYNNTILLDGEGVREMLSREYGYSVSERFAVSDNIIKLSVDSISNGNMVIVSTIDHAMKMRQNARDSINNFMEVYAKCPVDICSKRDYKDNYRKAFAGEYDMFVGITHQYEESERPELVIDTNKLSIEEGINLLHERVISRFYGG